MSLPAKRPALHPAIDDVLVDHRDACRHNLRANVAFVDGHIEAWNHADFASNQHDSFALRSR